MSESDATDRRQDAVHPARTVTGTFEASGFDQVLSTRTLEKHLARTSGIHDASASWSAQSVTVTYDPDVVGSTRISDEIRACGMHCRGEVVPRHVQEPPPAGAPRAAPAHEIDTRWAMARAWTWRRWRATCAGDF